MGEDVADLADGDHGAAGFAQRVEDGVGRWRRGEILAIAGALETTFGRADEGPGGGANDLVVVAEFAPDLAEIVEPLQPEGFLVGRDLQHAVDGGVDDGLAGAQMLYGEFLDDGRAGSMLVAENAGKIAALD